MKPTIDPIMQELWAAKDANAKQQGNLESYVTRLLRLQAKDEVPSHRVKPRLAANRTKRLRTAA